MFPDFLILSGGADLYNCNEFEDYKEYSGFVLEHTWQKKLGLKIGNWNNTIIEKIFLDNVKWLTPYEREWTEKQLRIPFKAKIEDLE